MEILELRDADVPAIDEYALQEPHATPFHLAGWKGVLEKSYGHRVHYLVAREGGRTVGLLPLLEVQSWLMGRSLTSLPGGICASEEEAAAALLARAEVIARTRNLDTVVLRDARQRWEGQWSTVNNHVAYVVELTEDTDALWKGLDKNLRRQVRMARQNGLTVTIGRDPDAVEAFYRIWCIFTRGMGTPVFGRKFLQRVVDAFHDRVEIVQVQHEGTVLGAYMQLQVRDTVYGMWGASLPEYLSLRPNYLIYWEIMRHAAEQGYGWLDMGRSQRDSGAAAFKKQWGGTEAPIYRQCISLRGSEMTADASERAQSTRWFELYKQVWRRLPLDLTIFLGARLRRHLPFA